MLTNAQQQARENEFEQELEYFDTYRMACGFKSVWSIFHEDVQFGQDHPYGENLYIHYHSYGAPTANVVKVLGSRWGDIYNACDRAIRESGNLHHIYIEGFEQKANKLHLSVGS